MQLICIFSISNKNRLARYFNNKRVYTVCMEYNIHPIIVHFPIALLVLYSCIKLLPLQRLFPNFGWKSVEQVLLVVGLIGSFAAMASGDVAENLVRPPYDLVEAHEHFASFSILMYGLLLAGEISFVINRKFSYIKSFSLVTIIFRLAEKILTHPALVFLLALAGLVGMFMTGLLGGVLVHGMTADPLAPILLPLLGINV